MDSEPLVPWREISALSLDRAEVLEAERDELRAENERLRAALTEIMQDARGLDYAIQIARVALGSDKCRND